MLKKLKPDYLFEVSWEVCNKVGGIHTVLTSKASLLIPELETGYIFIGPDVMREDQNLEFTETPHLMKSWRNYAASENLGVKVGHWNIEGSPTVFLVDYSKFFSQKDEIFAKMWEWSRVDSMSGRWDYVEAALFGYAAARVIESYSNFHIAPQGKIIAHFHEWMTGSGVIYLKNNAPRIGCVFTTHATVVGRCIAGNNLPLYDPMENYNSDQVASDFSVVARHSLEKQAARNADSFTTVSTLTAKECKAFLGRDVDVVTPNGFKVPFSVNGRGRKKMIEVAEALIGYKLDENVLLLGTSGRYEYRNKGLDVILKSLANLNKDENNNREIAAFIFVPSGSRGPAGNLLKNLSHPGSAPIGNRFLTHDLQDEHYDTILNVIRESGITNEQTDKVKVFFVPCYLNGDDGVFNLEYYELLSNLDLSLFPSYYEPWGYTPLESIAYGVPTVTTSLSGFGVWVDEYFGDRAKSVTVIKRNDKNFEEVVAALSARIIQQCEKRREEIDTLKLNAKEIANSITWDNFIEYYIQAYAEALEKVGKRYDHNIIIKMEQTDFNPANMPRSTEPNWHQILIHRTIPESLRQLDELSKNLWWSWSSEAINLFKYIHPEMWKQAEYNPILFLDRIGYQRFLELEKDHVFVEKLNTVSKMFAEYMSKKEEVEKQTRIAYFCMEYGLHSSLKIYSGGLGILAGDYLKEASDKGVNITAVGLLYRYGYFTQKLSAAGDQVAQYEPQHFDKIPVSPVRDSDGNWMSVEIAFPGRVLNARIWKTEVGRTDLYLLDTDHDSNLPEDRAITYHLYGGDWENRLKQEILLGVGGIRALEKMGIKAEVYHCNEGHAAMIGFERMHQLIQRKNLSFDEAKEVVRGSSLFTTHTPVPAGHDAFEEGLLRKYISHYPERFQVDWSRIIALGRMNPSNTGEKFSMSCLATNLSQEVNGVSWLHGKVTREMFQGMFPGYLAEELSIGYVTNGVHYPTWTAPIWKQLYSKVFGKDFANHHYDKSCFSNIQRVEDQEIWDIRNELRGKLIDHVKTWVSSKNDINYYSPREIVDIKESLNPKTLTIGFARRFATYKRAHLLFKDIDQLSRLINNEKRPVQFIFAGKAHPADKAGQDLIKRIVEISKYPQFIGKILFLENYDMELAAKMVRGVDIWLNTPTRPLEASGTSGEKAVMNGAMHFSVLDGWWVEGYKEKAGWCLPLEQTYENDDFQNELDAEMIYSIIENEIAPLYYDRDANGIPKKWISYVKNSISYVASEFTTNRMMTDYEERFYSKLETRTKEIAENDYKLAKELSEWKRKMLKEWEHIDVLSVKQPNSDKEPIFSGQTYTAEVVLGIGILDPNDVGVEILLAEDSTKGRTIKVQKQFSVSSHQGSEVSYKLSFVPEESGMFSVGIRIFANHPKLPHRQDFCLVKWI